jgi:DNA topoisomerase VI subunit B
VIEAHGVAHHVMFSVDHIRQEPKIEHTTRPSRVVSGTRVTVELPYYGAGDDASLMGRKCRFLGLAESYAWLNPHLSLRVTWNGKTEIEVAASNPAWAKWLPSWPTSAHWYDKSRFRRYMAAHISHRGSITVREFVSEFDGMSGTAKQKLVLAETGASHVSLHEFFGRSTTNDGNIEKLLAAIRKYSRPVKPARLGIIGREHLFRMMEAAGGEPKTFKYTRRAYQEDGLPHVIETAFGVHRSGLIGADTVQRGKIITGVNWSPGINNPFRQIGNNGAGLDAVLEKARANKSRPVIVMLHLACPRVAYTDRGKSAIVIEGNGGSDDEE